MKILTLNTHSLLEENYEEKLKQFAEMVKKELPRVFALQEVNQSMSAEKIEKPKARVVKAQTFLRSLRNLMNLRNALKVFRFPFSVFRSPFSILRIY